MTLKDKIAFALYASAAIAIVAESTIVIAREVKYERKLKKNLKAAEEAEKTN